MDKPELKVCLRCGGSFEYFYNGRGRQRTSCYSCSPPDKRKNCYAPKEPKVEKLLVKSNRSLQSIVRSNEWMGKFSSRKRPIASSTASPPHMISYKEIAGAHYIVHIIPWSTLRPKESIRAESKKNAVQCADKYRCFGERAEIETFLPSKAKDQAVE